MHNLPFTPNQLAFKRNALPCSPIPFLNELIEKTKAHGSDFLKTDPGKMLLWTINMQAFGDLATIDMCEEYSRLTKVVQENLGTV